MRVPVLFVLAVLGVGLVVAVPPAATPAWACYCVRPDDGRADLIVVGTVTEVTDTGIRMAVESVVKGTHDTAAPLRLASGRDGNTCGYEFRAGRRYRVNSTDGATGLCAGVQALPASAPPVPEASAAPVSAAPVSAATPSATSSGPGWLTAAAVLVLAAGVLGLVHRRRRTDTTGT